MNKCYLILLLSLAGFNLCKAQSADAALGISYLTLQDTVFITVGGLKDKIVEHRVAEKQTLYGLTKFYGLNVSTLYAYNPDLKNNLTIDQRLYVPLPNRAIIRYEKKSPDFHSRHIPICYVVNDDETLYRICKKYFKMSVDTIKKRNHLDTHIIRKGQVLHIGWLNVNGIPKRLQNNKPENGYVNVENLPIKEKYDTQKLNKREIEQKGVASWQRNTKLSGTYALHRDAAINSIVAVTNLMNNRTIYVKVIGRIPATVYDADVLTVISPKVAKMLGAKDPRFFVRVKYLK